MPCWKITGLLLGLRSSHQRTPDTTPLGPVAGIHRLIGDQRFVSAKVTIGKPKQRTLAIAQMIDFVGGTRLRNTLARMRCKLNS